MKRLQKGFTLIELMIVVAIIGILAAVAIPAYQDYIVKAKLSKVVSTLDPVKTALALYFQEQGGFPIPDPATDLIGSGGKTPGTQTVVGTFWNSLGFSVYPSLPIEVKTLGVHAAGPAGGTAPNIALILEVQSVKAGTIDGAWIALSPNNMGNAANAFVTPASASTSSLTATETVSGASALQWYYGCNKGNITGAAVDAVVKNFFKNGNSPMTTC
ncbi:MAG: prepilin-type N-terminal cleavage/methylation domain-containing protein [Nitrosomonadales bacterium]|nr:prepilin-type N-terminal cleavage/methylation domain-containing protein [Nitrosomonadales bacterium]